MNTYYADDGEGFAFLPPSECSEPYTISGINEGIAAILESGNTTVWFTGEISNWKHHTSGHCYFRLKDAHSQVPAVLWSSAVPHLAFPPEDGMAVSGIASIRVYRKGGYYQLDVRRMQPAGRGALYAAFEALKKKLTAEGMFDEERKRSLPRSVTRLGVVTSGSGAALRDIVRVVATRAPHTDIVLYSVPVQGDGAAAQIARGIERMATHGGVDCMIVGRGGGSIEDLWAFNEEVVARAIVASPVPVISAVGHETDFTIADFAADVRAATPSAAAELAVADEEENRRYLAAVLRQFAVAAVRLFGDKRDALRRAARAPALRAGARRILDLRQELDDARQRTGRTIRRALHDRHIALGGLSARLNALSPLGVLQRGYAVVSRDGAVVRHSAELSAGDTVDMRFAAGSATAQVSSTKEESDGASKGPDIRNGA